MKMGLYKNLTKNSLKSYNKVGYKKKFSQIMNDILMAVQRPLALTIFTAFCTECRTIVVK